MREADKQITVKFRYTDVRSQQRLRTAFRIELSSNYEKGLESYFRDVIHPLLVANEDRIVLDTTGRRAELLYEPVFANRKILTDFIGRKDEIAGKIRTFNDGFLRIVDAFLQIKDCVTIQSSGGSLTLDGLGAELGAFLKDQDTSDDLAQKAINIQEISGIYRYSETDTHLVESGERRILVFLRGENLDYLRVVDFLDQPASFSSKASSNVNLVSGICIPGEEFSPVLTRSATYHTRHIGMLYTRGSLIGMSGEALDDLTYESFTTDKSSLGSAAKSDESAHSMLFAQALDLHYGPRLRRDLAPVSTVSEKTRISKIVGKFAQDML